MIMLAVRIVLLCVGSALVCAMIRVHRPEMATAISLAVGLGVLLLSREAFESITSGIQRFLLLTGIQNENTTILLKAAGITILSELGVQICCDAGESALAGRIRLVCRIVILGMAMPFIMQIIDSIELLSR